MDSKYYREEPATPQYVLDLLFSDYHLYHAILPKIFGTKIIEPETSIGDWLHRRELDDLTLDCIALELNEVFHLELSEDNWFEELQSARSIWDLAVSLSRHVRRPVLLPITVSGKECFNASAFLALKDMLQQDGVDVTKLAPSTSVKPILNESLTFQTHLRRVLPCLHKEVFCEKIRVSGIKELWEHGDLLSYGFWGTLLTVCLMFFYPPAAGIMVIISLCAFVLILLGVPLPVTRLKFRDIESFRDLTERIAALQTTA
ncbi:MAG: hypothetical protein KDA65_11315 [Planctomycetaceae bacterium]|nr:hypothetical protein [Planctomycetaceae bacterium]